MSEATVTETDEERAARLEAEQAALDAGVDLGGVDAAMAELDGDGRDLPDGAADDEPGGDAQDGLFDGPEIEDDALAAVLDERERLRLKKRDATAKFKEKHDVAKGKIDALDLADGSVVRCGRHRIEVKRVAGRSVSFETAPTRRLTIKLFED